MCKLWLVNVSEIVVASMGKMIFLRENKTPAVLNNATHSEQPVPYFTPPADLNLVVVLASNAVWHRM